MEIRHDISRIFLYIRLTIIINITVTSFYALDDMRERVKLPRKKEGTVVTSPFPSLNLSPFIIKRKQESYDRMVQ